MKEANQLDYQIVTDVTQNTIKFNEINSLGFTAYTEGGVLEYNKPVPINNLTARMQIREKVNSPTIIYQLTTENGGILFNSMDSTISINIPDEVTSTFTFNSSVYSLEFEDTVTGQVVPFAKGSMILDREVTR
jgi:hypothetical protein